MKLLKKRVIELGCSSAGPSVRDCILLAACEAHEKLPQSVEFPADVFTSCLTFPIKMALRWFCTRSLLHESLDYSLIDRIPGKQTDQTTLLGVLNWIFTAVTDMIAWNVLPHEIVQTSLLVASLFRNFFLAERIMRSANCLMKHACASLDAIPLGTFIIICWGMKLRFRWFTMPCLDVLVLQASQSLMHLKILFLLASVKSRSKPSWLRGYHHRNRELSRTLKNKTHDKHLIYMTMVKEFWISCL